MLTIHTNNKMYSIVATASRNGIVACSIHVQLFAFGTFRRDLFFIRLQPVSFKEHTAIRSRALLVKRRPCARLKLEGGKKLSSEPFWPKNFTRFAPKQIIVTLTFSRQADNVPIVTIPA